eukprot:TRINITY_DN386_c0_g1_i2.p1 TRINITY_DN386_c0_g1~~TRINITY_DN386_c0_g1_i2.p1  ORF type:complete len:534 (+),score=100.61 TRINITY_DN386_c0_g1_i2:75-1604(+)
MYGGSEAYGGYSSASAQGGDRRSSSSSSREYGSGGSSGSGGGSSRSAQAAAAAQAQAYYAQNPYGAYAQWTPEAAAAAYYYASPLDPMMDPSVMMSPYAAQMAGMMSHPMLGGGVEQGQSHNYTTVYVGNLSSELSEDIVRTFFSACGLVTNLRLAGDPSYPTRFGFVEFQTPEAALKAVYLSGTELDGRRLRITMSKNPIGSAPPESIRNSSPGGAGASRRSSYPGMTNPHDSPEMVSRTVYVSGVDPELTEDHLIQFFSVCGTVTQCRLCGDGRHPTRFAFVEFASVEAATTALGLSGVTLGFSPLKVMPSKASIQSTASRRPSAGGLAASPRTNYYAHLDPVSAEKAARTIYVGNVPAQCSEQDLKGAFDGCGKIVKLVLTEGSATDSSRRFAFIEFESSDGAHLALDMDGMDFGSQALRISRSKTPIHSSKSAEPAEIPRNSFNFPIRDSDGGKRKREDSPSAASGNGASNTTGNNSTGSPQHDPQSSTPLKRSKIDEPRQQSSN